MQSVAETNELFWWWINERHRVYLAKTEGKPWPWTEDPILQEFSFCNVFRELDKVTIAFRTMFKDVKDPKKLIFSYCVARSINWPETVQALIGPSGLPDAWDPEAAYTCMRARQEAGLKLYTGAYILGASHDKGEDNNKPKYTVYTMLDPVWKALELQSPPTDSIKAFSTWLEGFTGWGGFLAYEVATDLRHTPVLQNAKDTMTWANVGPGALRGLQRLSGRNLQAHLSQDEALREMIVLLKNSHNYLEPHIPLLELRDIEHSLCDYDKWMRAKNGEGYPRAKYHRSGTVTGRTRTRRPSIQEVPAQIGTLDLMTILKSQIAADNSELVIAEEALAKAQERVTKAKAAVIDKKALLRQQLEELLAEAL